MFNLSYLLRKWVAHTKRKAPFRWGKAVCCVTLNVLHATFSVKYFFKPIRELTGLLPPGLNVKESAPTKFLRHYAGVALGAGITPGPGGLAYQCHLQQLTLKSLIFTNPQVVGEAEVLF